MQPTTPPPEIVNAPREEQVAHLRDYWRIIWRHRWTVAAVFLCVVLVTAVWTFLQTPIYRATGTVEVQAQARRAMGGPDVSGLGVSGYGWAAEERFYSTQIEIVRSREMAQRVIRRLKLDEDPNFKGAKDLVGALSGMVSVDLRRDTGIIEISVTGPDPRQATELANAYASEYVERNLDTSRQAVRQLVDEMSRQLQPIKEMIEAAEKQRFGVAQSAEIYIPENQKAIIEKDLEVFGKELTNTRTDMIKLVGALQGIEAARQHGGDPLTIPEIQKDPAAQQLVADRTALERELLSLRVTYLPGAPKVKETQSELGKVERRLEERIREIEGGLRTQYAQLRGQEAALVAQIEKTRRESFSIGQKSSEYEIVKADVETRRNAYNSLLASVAQISLQANLLNNNLTILDKAIVPTAPIKPRTRLNLFMGTMLGLMLGLGMAFFLDYLDNTIKSSDDIEQLLRLHLLSIIPRYRETTGHAVKEAYQTLRTSVLFSSRGRQNRVLLITSAGPREGKTSTIVNLARTIASAGERVVILDCDLRRPKVHEDLGLDREPGVTNFLAGMEGSDYREFIRPTAVPTLSALTCGPIPPNPPELFGTERFRDLLSALRRDFDWVLLDSPPVASLTDAVILASMVEMVAFVVKHNENDRDMIRRCVANIRNVNPNIIGAVLNSVDIERAGGDYYYAGYYYYTADKSEGRRRGARRSRGEREKIGAAR